MFKEFKEFALKGNLIDMAVAFVMGAAFTKLSTAFIEDLIMPVIGRISGGMDYSNKFIALSDKVVATDLVSGENPGCRDRLRQLHHHRHQLRHRRLRDVPGGQGDQQGQEAR